MVKITIENFKRINSKEVIYTDQFLLSVKKDKKNVLFVTRQRPDSYCKEVKSILENLKIKEVV
jgi:hypothetical protein